jgi:hypothetical protein
MRSERNPEELISCWTLDEADWRLLANKTGATRVAPRAAGAAVYE